MLPVGVPLPPASRLAMGCLAACVLGIGGCSSVTPMAPLARVRLGPAAAQPLRRVVALPSTCGAVDGDCKDGYTTAVDGAIRQELEFAGFSVVDSETLAGRARERRQRLRTEGSHCAVRAGGVALALLPGLLCTALAPRRWRCW